MERKEIIYILGTKKGVGKTTVLNHFLRRWKNCCVASIGLDGEEKDNLTNEPKPCVHVTKYHLVLTGERFLNLSKFEVIDVYSHNAIVGHIILARPLIETTVVLTGATTAMIQRIVVEQKFSKIIIDGAFNRLIHAGVIDGAKIFLVVHGDELESMRIIKKVLFASNLPRAPQHILEVFHEKRGVWAFTKDGSVTKISDSCLTLKHFSESDFEWLYISGFVTQSILEMKDKIKICLANPIAIAEVPSNFDNIYTANSIKLERMFINSSEHRELLKFLKTWLGDSIAEVDDVFSV